MSDHATLTLESLVVERGGRPVVHGVDVTVQPSQVTTMLGPNGAGKSSIAAAIAGLAHVGAGAVKIDGTNLTNLRPEKIRANGISVVPEGRRLLTDLTVEDNLRVSTYSLGKQAASEGLAYTLSLFPELEKRWKIGGRLLSGGEQQMVVLAQALVSKPKVLIVDELSLGLAPIVVQRLMPVLAEVADNGTAVLLIEQFAHVALSLATKAYVLEGGRIRYDGTAAELSDNPDMLHATYLLRD
jgi:branched-chain amino acid transport system ATP-binding protein